MIGVLSDRIRELDEKLDALRKDFYALRQHYMQKEKIEDDKVFDYRNLG
jgi:hypothetical protein